MNDARRSLVISELNARAAELNELGLLVHVAHVNVTGPHFLALHQFFGDLYESLLTGHADVLMERVRALGGAATRSPAALPPIPETGEAVAIAAAVRDALRAVISRLSATRAMVAGEVDPDTYRILDDVVHDLDKPAWMLVELSVEPPEHNMGDAGDVLKLGQRLGTAEEKVRLLAVEKTTLARDNERLTLEAKAKDAKIAELVATAAVSAAELTKLRDAETKRGEEAVNARVDEAFATYKDVHKLSDAHRPMMVRELRADPANFEILYPRVAANQQHLTAPGPGGAGGIAPAMTYETQRLLADKLVKERHMTREQATTYAYRVATGAAPMPTSTSN